MVRFAGAGRWVWRHPIIGLPLLTWVLLTPLAHWLLPVTPIQRIDVTELVPPGETSKPARHPDYPDRAIFTTVDIEKNTACTAIETKSATNMNARR